jgi:hypothetical protein
MGREESRKESQIMTRQHLRIVLGIGVLIAGLAGCQKPDMSAMMTKPERPAELDHLSKLVGHWHGTAEMRMPGSDEVGKSTYTSASEWDLDGWTMTERVTITIEDGEKMNSMGIWAWDAKAKKFHIWYFSDWGNVGTGTCTFDEETMTWTGKSKSRDMVSGQTMVSKYKMKLVDDHTMEWEETVYDSLGMTKYFELSGTGHKK